MKKLTTLTSLLVIGTTLSYLITLLLTSDDITLDLSDEEAHLYL
jgi:hypothetical protein